MARTRLDLRGDVTNSEAAQPVTKQSEVRNRVLDLIEQLVKEAGKVPLMVLCVARWEFLEQRPCWVGGIAANLTLC